MDYVRNRIFNRRSKNAIFFAILCGVLEIIPFGNLIGNALAILVTLVQGGGTNVIIGILITLKLNK